MRLIPLRFAALAALALLFMVAPGASAGGSVAVVVLKEHGIGSAAQAQPHVDRFVAIAKERNGWSSAEGKYVTRRSKAEKYIANKNPHYGILSLGAFLAMRKPHGLTVVGLAEVARAGGRRYYIISKDVGDLGGCKGNTLATNHADDPKFINKVVAGGDFTLDSFNLVPTRRPVQTIKKVARGEAKCALIDDAQMAALGNVSGAEGISDVWKSKLLPPMPVVAFPSASASERSTFQGNLGSLCTGSGAKACKKVGLKKLKSAGEGTYESVISDYQR